MKTLICLLILSVILLPERSASQSWTQSLNGRNVWSLAYDGLGKIYAGGLTGSNSRIWRSTDAGVSWDTIYFGTGQTVWDFAFDEQLNIYAANFSAGMLKSTNAGLNFAVTPVSAFNNKNLQGIECGDSGYVYVATSSGFFRSTDYGTTFSETALTGLNCLPVIVDRDSSNIVYIGVSSAGGTGIGFYRSTDKGLTFSSNLNPGKNGYNLAQSINGNLYMITTTPPYNFDKSTNKGLNWTTVSNTGSGQRGIAAGFGNSVYTSGNGGVFKSANGGANFSNFNFTSTVTPVLYVEFNATARVLTGASGSSAGVWVITEQLTHASGSETTVIPSFTLELIYPNPFNPFANIVFSIGTKGKYTLSVFDASGRIAEVLQNGFLETGRYEVPFYTKELASGVYYAVLHGGGKSITKKLALIK